MSAPILACPAHTNRPKPEVIRRTAGYHPSVWGDRFLNYTPDNTITHARKEQQIKELKEEVRRELMAAAAAASEPLLQLSLIDAVQRLGLGYHFEKEIEEALQHIYDTYHDSDDDDGDLHRVFLRFRLLRQQGFDLSCDVFNKFKDEKGSFKESLTADMKCMLGLYEATHLMKHGEDILDEAMTFTIAQLARMATDLSNPLTPQIIRALKQPLRKGLPRLEERHYISIYEQDGSHNKTLLKFAKLDFNWLQSLHLKELSEITRWWKDLDFARKLPFARDRLVECYFWMLGVYFEPRYFLGRRILTKVIAMDLLLMIYMIIMVQSRNLNSSQKQLRGGTSAA